MLASNQSPTFESNNMLNNNEDKNSSLINQENSSANSSILYPSSKNENSSLSNSSSSLPSFLKSPPPLPTPSNLEKPASQIKSKKPSQFIEQKNSIVRKYSLDRKVIGQKDQQSSNSIEVNSNKLSNKIQNKVSIVIYLIY